MEITLKERFTKMLSPNKEMLFVIRPKICVSHVSHESYTIIDFDRILELSVNVICPDPFGFHKT